MSDESSRADIRRLLKRFGIEADEAIVAHIARHPEGPPLAVRLTMVAAPSSEGDDAPEELRIEIEGEVRR